MKVKKYTGKTIQDTIFKVKAELGSDAIILNTRKYKTGGVMGLFAQKQVEVLAALEEKDKGNQRTLQEIENLKKVVTNLNEKWETEGFVENLSDELAVIYHHLNEQGVKEDLSKKIVEQLEEETEDESGFFQNIVWERLKDFVGKCQPIKFDSKRKVILLTGSTGVGKTTTIAKLAAKFKLEENKKVGLLTADTYRIAAVQQLKTYSDIINVPLKVVYNAEEFNHELQNNFNGYDIVLVDTAGSSWNDKLQLGRLKKFAKHRLVNEVHLLISLNTKSENIEMILDHFSILNPDKLILSKMDETNTFGDIINIQSQRALPYSYITFGQDVPDDIKEANDEIIIEYLLGDYNE